ncbi:hypothetical protein NM688_g6252 [Phlebia brevispora]|uniref:Uncharacterized protein n=1 Tax=Phlebia brevispora TaxID=194682 RepID=A0ACC1SI18_9APHY|nr:hypothetical protein NM688_g6252 [Phlebia brevispora]
MKSGLSISLLATYETGVLDKPLQLSQGTVRAVIAIVSQAFTIAYCAALVWLMQRITMHEFTRYPQTLTAIHDKSFAWLGLGSSLQTLGRQAKLATDVLGISMITLYLLLIFVVHTTLPSVFGVATQNVTTLSTYPTTLARQPNVTLELQIGSGADVEIDNGWANLYAILQVYDTLDLPTVSVLDNMLYDIIPIVQNAADTELEVNATTFSVDCACLPDVIQQAFAGPNFTGDQSAIYEFTFAGDQYLVDLVAMGELFSRNIFVISRTITQPNILAVATTYPVVDSAGDSAPSISINPIWQDVGDNPNGINITGINLIGCNFNVHNSTVEVDAQSRAVNQQPSLPMPTLHVFISETPLSPSVESPALVLLNDTFKAIAYVPAFSVLDQFLQMEVSASRNARAYSAVLWYYNAASATSLDLVFNDIGANKFQGQVLIPSSVLQERITVNKISLFVGLGNSCVLFVLAIVLIIRRGGLTRDDVHRDVSGVLPILWLLGKEPRLMSVEDPDIDALRAAGMYEVAGIDQFRRYKDAGSVEEQDAKHELQSLSEAYHSVDQLLIRRKSHICSACGAES